LPSGQQADVTVVQWFSPQVEENDQGGESGATFYFLVLLIWIGEKLIQYQLRNQDPPL
jgi:hypothetical protein